MGMSASQVRFLSLQTRKNEIGNELSTLANRKSSLARDMKVISAKYDNATNETELKWSYDSGETYTDISYDLLMRPNLQNALVPYIITDANTGKVIINDDAIKDIDGNVVYIPGTSTPLTYKTIASMISEFGNPNPDAYVIPNTYTDFTFGSSLRTNIFRQLGILTDSSMSTYTNAITELYGSQEAIDSNIYPLGTAMGDLYFAKQNLEAFKAVKSQKYKSTFETRQTASSGTYQYNVSQFEINYNYNSSTTNITQGLDSRNSSEEFTHMNITSSDAQSAIAANYRDYNFSITLSDGVTMNVQTDVVTGNVQYSYSIPSYMQGLVHSDTNSTTAITDWDYYFLNNTTRTYNHHTSADLNNCNSMSGGNVEVVHNLWNGETGMYVNATNNTNDYIDAVGEALMNGNYAVELNEDAMTAAIYAVKQAYGSCVNITGPDGSDWRVRFGAAHGNSASACNCMEDYRDYVNNTLSDLLGNFAYVATHDGNTHDSYYAGAMGLQHRSAYELVILKYLDLVNGTHLSDPYMDKPHSIDTYGISGAETISQLVSTYTNSDKSFLFSLNSEDVDSILNNLETRVSQAQSKVDTLKSIAENAFLAIQKKQMDYYDALFQKIAQSGWVEDENTSVAVNGRDSYKYLQQKMQNNTFFITECKTAKESTGYMFVNKMAMNVNRVYNVHNYDKESQALAEYEEAKTEINMKEQKIDVIMSKLETEENAIETEMDSLKRVVDDNIKTVFKMFA